LKTISLHRWLWLLTACGVAVLAACSERPDSARFDNPFDPASGAGDPFQLVVSFEGGNVVIRWNAVHEDEPGIVSYLVSHSALPAGPFRLLEEIPIEEGFETVYLHSTYIRDGYNYYIVQARKVDGISSASLVTAMGIRTAPTVRNVTGLELTGTRSPLLELRPLLVSGESFELSLDPGFASFSSFDSAEVAADVVYDLGSAMQGDVFRLYSRVRRGGLVDTTGEDSLIAALRVDMQPQLNGLGQVEDTLLTLDLFDLEGVTQMRFALSETELAAAPWEIPDGDPSAQTREISLDAGQSQFELHGEFESDFGFRETRLAEFEAQELITGAQFGLLGSALETGTTADPAILVTPISASGATLMRFSEDPAFSGVPWEPMDASYQFTLSAPPGQKVVFGEFKNPFSNTATDSASIILLGDP
jgi:hypothetical protein